jgi:hypothetical protein
LSCSMNGHNIVIVADPASPKKNITIKGEYEFCHLSDENSVTIVTGIIPNPRPAENPAKELCHNLRHCRLIDRIDKGMPTTKAITYDNTVLNRRRRSMPSVASRKVALVVSVTTAIAKADIITAVARGETKNPKSNFFDII